MYAHRHLMTRTKVCTTRDLRQFGSTPASQINDLPTLATSKKAQTQFESAKSG